MFINLVYLTFKSFRRPLVSGYLLGFLGDFRFTVGHIIALFVKHTNRLDNYILATFTLSTFHWDDYNHLVLLGLTC